MLRRIRGVSLSDNRGVLPATFLPKANSAHATALPRGIYQPALSGSRTRDNWFEHERHAFCAAKSYEPN